MAEGDVERKPRAFTSEDSENLITVKLLVDGLIPEARNKKKAKNGEVDVTLFKRGFDMTATIKKSGGHETKWRFAVKKLPSEIVINRSTWELDKGMIVIKLHKKEEISWVPMLVVRGLEQEESSDESNSTDDEKIAARSAVTSPSMVQVELCKKQ